MQRSRHAQGFVGSSERSSGFTTAEVMARFERLTGHRLVVRGRFESRPILSGFDSLEPALPLKEFASFDVGIFYDIERSKAEGILSGLTRTKGGHVLGGTRPRARRRSLVVSNEAVLERTGRLADRGEEA
jgi:hypothetical protein